MYEVFIQPQHKVNFLKKILCVPQVLMWSKEVQFL